MLKIFVKFPCSSSRLAKKWLNQFHLDYKEQNITRMTREELIHIVSLSEFGFEELMVGKTARTTKEAGLLQGKLAELAGKDQGTIARIETMKVNPTLKVISEIAMAMNKKVVIHFEDVDLDK